MTYKYTSKVDEEYGERGDKVKSNGLIDWSELPVVRKLCGSNYLNCEGRCK